MVNPSKPLSYWAMHVTHVAISAIIYSSLVLFTLLSVTLPEILGKSVLMSADSVAAVWIVVGAGGAYFVSRISVTAQGIQVVTGKPNTITPS